ncbi:uncharacterized protein LOC135249320 isoform X2 [Anguilla rostrata]|uniref:uncharacterized protein LOC135249320 isoform X2 n=1 Tax=Anguilla rostrata TaxID=7938 RepID=UPI0030D08F17
MLMLIIGKMQRYDEQCGERNNARAVRQCAAGELNGGSGRVLSLSAAGPAWTIHEEELHVEDEGFEDVEDRDPTAHHPAEPSVSRPACSSPPSPWMFDPLRTIRASLRAAERKWRKSMAQSDLSAYQSLLAAFSIAVTSAKMNYQTKIHKSASNPHQLFSIFSSHLSTPPPPPQSSLAADDFAVFFDEKIADICSSFMSTATLPHSPLSVPSPCFSTFSPLTDSDVSQLLLSHRPTTCALDPIPSSLLQTITPDILPFVTSLVNSSLSSGCFPSSFKLAHITPLLKKPTLDPSVIQNYRPVSLLPFLSKTIERAASNNSPLFSC